MDHGPHIKNKYWSPFEAFFSLCVSICLLLVMDC